MKAKLFQEFFFNGLFGRLFFRSKSAGAQREFLLQKETKSLWNSSNMYLLLPLEKTSSCDPYRINWMGINSCVSAVEILKKSASLGAERFNGKTGNLAPCINGFFETKCNSADFIHLANDLVDTNNLKDMVVLAIHTGKIYSVFKIMGNMTAESPFDGSTDTTPSEYTSFAEYFNKK